MGVRDIAQTSSFGSLLEKANQWQAAMQARQDKMLQSSTLDDLYPFSHCYTVLCGSVFTSQVLQQHETCHINAVPYSLFLPKCGLPFDHFISCISVINMEVEIDSYHILTYLIINSTLRAA